MIPRVILILALALFVTSCGGAAPSPTQAPVVPPLPTGEPAQSPISGTSTPAGTSTPIPTHTPAPTLTDTPLPTLALPTEALSAPARLVWDGMPTYPGDSTPGYAFRVTYEPDVWALTTDQFGFPALGHRRIPNCILSVTVGRGLPPSLTVEHELLQAGEITFDVGTAFENGVRKFVTFTGGDGIIITAFELSFQEESEACLADALAVLSSLRSVPVSQATPVP